MSDLRGFSRTFIKIRQIGTATERHMLAIINVRSIRQCIRSGATAEIRTLFEQPDFQAGFGEHRRRRQTCESSANDDHAFAGHVSIHPSFARSKIPLFSPAERRTRLPETACGPAFSILLRISE